MPPANGELLARGIAGARLERLDGAGHMFWWEQPERSAELIRAHVLRRPAPSTARRPGAAARRARGGARRRGRRGSPPRRGARRPCGRRRTAAPSISRSTARSRSPASRAAKASATSSVPSRSSAIRARSPSAAKEPVALASACSAASVSPRRCSAVARPTAAAVLLGSSSSARRRDSSSPWATSSSASLGTRRSKNCATCGGRDRAGELVDHAAVLERLDGRDALDAERLADLRVGVGVDLRQVDLALARVRGLLERRRELPARAAPRGPEVHDHGHLV